MKHAPRDSRSGPGGSITPASRVKELLSTLGVLQRYAPAVPGLIALGADAQRMEELAPRIIAWTLGALILTGMCWLMGIQLWWNHYRRSGQARPLPGLTAPAMDDNLAAIRETRSHWGRMARGRQSSRMFWAVFSALLGPAAVIALATQVVFFHGPEDWRAWALIAAEVLFLAVAAATVHFAWPAGRVHSDWVAARLRSEILRREEHLYLAGVGPYQSGSDPAWVRQRLDSVNQRQRRDFLTAVQRDTLRLRAALSGAHRHTWAIRLLFCAPRLFYLRAQRRGRREAEVLEALIRLMEMSHLEQGRTKDWRDDLEDARLAGPAISQPLPTLREQAEWYLHNRLENQRAYYDGAAAKHGLMDEAWESMAVTILGVAAVLGVIHWRLLGLGDHPATAAKLVELVALGLPPLGGAFVAMRAAFENQHLTRSYADMARQLGRLGDDIRSRILAVGPDSHEFRRLVLRVETLLSQENYRWAVIVTPARPKGGP